MKIKAQISLGGGGVYHKHFNHIPFTFYISHRQSGKLTQSGKLGLATFALYSCIKQSHRSSLLTYMFINNRH